jgi:hypothetical protein
MLLLVAEFYPPTDLPTELFAGGPSHTPRDLLAEIFSYPDIYLLRFFLPTDLLAC